MVHRRHRVRYYRQCGSSSAVPPQGTAVISSDITFEISRLPTSSSDESCPDTSFVGPLWKNDKWIVYESKLLELFKKYRECQGPVETMVKKRQGGMLKIEWVCINNHSGHWTSCPSIRGVPEINLLTSSAVLFTGASRTTISNWAHMMNLQLMKRSAFDNIQSTYLLPAVEQVYG